MDKSGVLIGQRNIAEYLGIGRRTLVDMLKNGMPVTKIKGRWFAYKPMLDEYFESMIKKELSKNKKRG